MVSLLKDTPRWTRSSNRRKKEIQVSEVVRLQAGGRTSQNYHFLILAWQTHCIQNERNWKNFSHKQRVPKLSPKILFMCLKKILSSTVVSFHLDIITKTQCFHHVTSKDICRQNVFCALRCRQILEGNWDNYCSKEELIKTAGLYWFFLILENQKNTTK